MTERQAETDARLPAFHLFFLAKHAQLSTNDIHAWVFPFENSWTELVDIQALLPLRACGNMTHAGS